MLPRRLTPIRSRGTPKRLLGSSTTFLHREDKQGKREKSGEGHHRDNQNVTTALIPSFIPLTTYRSERTAVQEQPNMRVFKNKMLHLSYKRIGRNCTCFTNWLMLICYPCFYLSVNRLLHRLTAIHKRKEIVWVWVKWNCFMHSTIHFRWPISQDL